MTNKKDRTRKVHPSAPIYSESSSPYPSTSFSQFPPSQFVGSSVQKQYPFDVYHPGNPGVYLQPSVIASAPPTSSSLSSSPSSLSQQQQQHYRHPEPSVPECYFGLPPPPYSYSSSQCSSSDTYTTTNCAPPLPEREQIVIGRHAARFNIKKNHLQSTRCKSPTTHKRFINPIVSGKRNCTDISCCFLFVIFIVGWAFVAYLGKRFKNNFSF